jgi:hypothetical protein
VLGVAEQNVAILGTVETFNCEMLSTEAAAFWKMADRGRCSERTRLSVGLRQRD